MKGYFIILAGLLVLSFKAGKTEEGMFPLSYLSKLDLQNAGLKISTDEIYNENGTSLVNALVRLGGCTGSFISENGLIITNHHCVYGTVASLSSPERNYLENGFYAESSEKELKASFECKITTSFKDVSLEVLQDVTDVMTAVQQEEKIEESIKKITEEEQKAHPDLKIEISEMLVGKAYTLFRYKILEDVRIVFVPPKNIGKFGGETDNWEWPRHNGDFSIVRAYEDGKPYKPARYLKVNPSGSKEGDFAFILGYPGRTYRNQPAQFLTYQNEYILPIISDWFDFRIRTIENYVQDKDSLKLAFSGSLASLNNVSKNFKGKLQGLQRTDLIEKTSRDQKRLKEYASKTSKFKSYVPLFKELDSLYQRKFSIITELLYLGQMYSTCRTYSVAVKAHKYAAETKDLSKDEFEVYCKEHREEMDKDFNGLNKANETFSLDLQYFQELVFRLSRSDLRDVSQLIQSKGGDKTAVYTYAYKLYSDRDYLRNAQNAYADADFKKLFKLRSALTDFALKMQEQYQKLAGISKMIDTEIDAIIPKLNDIEQEMNLGGFIPDANGTLRFTYGYIKGYSPEDAIWFSPFTTVAGILEKSEGSNNPDYYLQDEFITKMKTIEPADVLRHPTENQVVVALLYNMDTTGGNSGSPILDAHGNIIGINFDRAYTATINDYAWNELYSRSIGVDIRYVLYIMKYFGQADALLTEIGVEL